MLTETQKRELDETGVVRLAGAIAKADAEVMLDRLWQELAALHGLHRDAPETWKECRPCGLQKISRSDAFAPTHCDAVREAADEILGTFTTQPVTNPLVNFGAAATEWNVPHAGWHLDLPATALDRVPGLRVFTFLDDVEVCGGSTAVVLGSHKLVGQVAKAAGRQPLPSRRVRETLRRREPWIGDLFSPGEASDRIRRFVEDGTAIGDVRLRVAELAGAPGDVVLMDLRMLHAPTPNLRPHPRMVLGQVVLPSSPSSPRTESRRQPM